MGNAERFAVLRAYLVVAAAVGLVACGKSEPRPVNSAAHSAVSTQRVVLLSIDGLLPATYLDPDAHGLAVPNLRRLAREGATATSMTSVFPSVTYPAHTTIATGQPPSVHGIETNRTFDPLDANEGGWHWYVEDIKVPTLWQRARDKGLSTAIVNWPVTVGAVADFNVPEVWRAGTADDLKLARALTTPRGLLAEIERAHPSFATTFTPPDVRDSANGDIVDVLLRRYQPSLIMAHFWWVDEMQHRHGVWSDEAKGAIELVDAQIGRLIQAAEEAGVLGHTTFVIASDHGFVAVEREVSIGAILANAGFIDVGPAGSITGWRASAVPDGGVALVRVASGIADREGAIEKVTRLFVGRSKRPEQTGIGRVFSRAELVAMQGGASFDLAVEAAPGFGFTRGVTGPEIIDAKSAATHGFHPDHPDMGASLLLWGASVSPRSLGDVALIDIAPTIASLLELEPQPLPGRDLL